MVERGESNGSSAPPGAVGQARAPARPRVAERARDRARRPADRAVRRAVRGRARGARVSAAPLRAHARSGRRADRRAAAARAAADGRVRGLRHLARRQRGRVPVAPGRRRVARRLRRARARRRRHEPHARRSRARGLRGDRSRARGDRPRRPPRRLLAGRHVLLPGRRVPQERGPRVDHHDGQPRRSASPAQASARTSPSASSPACAPRSSWPLARIEGLPGMFTSTGFKLLSRAQGGDAARRLRASNLHDRSALEKREAKRLFLGGEGFVAWPGPAFRKFVDERDRRQPHGVGRLRDRRPRRHARRSRRARSSTSSAAATRWAAPARCAASGARRRSVDDDVRGAGQGRPLRARRRLDRADGHVAERRRVDARRRHARRRAIDVRAQPTSPQPRRRRARRRRRRRRRRERRSSSRRSSSRRPRAPRSSASRSSARTSAATSTTRAGSCRASTACATSQDDSLISLGQSLADQAAEIGDRTFFLWRGRAFTYADANRRVDAVVRGLIACGVKPGQRVGVMMKSRPIAPVGRRRAQPARRGRGAAVARHAPTRCCRARSSSARPRSLIVDPESAARARAATAVKVLVLGGVGEQGELPPGMDAQRVIPPGVIDMESIDPATVTLPAWYKPDPGRARDLAMVFVSSRQARAAARDAHHEPPLGVLRARRRRRRDADHARHRLLLPAAAPPVGHARRRAAARSSAARASRSRSRFEPDDVLGRGPALRRQRRLLRGRDVPPPRRRAARARREEQPGAPVRRLAACAPTCGASSSIGSARSACSSSTRRPRRTPCSRTRRGKKIGSVGRPLPGSPEVAVAACDFADARLRARRSRPARARAPRRARHARRAAVARAAPTSRTSIRRACSATRSSPATRGSSPAISSTVDTDRRLLVRRSPSQMITTQLGAGRVDADRGRALRAARASRCASRPSRRDPDDATHEIPIAAIQLQPDTRSISTRSRRGRPALPEYARPRDAAHRRRRSA